MENRNLLHIPLDSPEPVTSPVITRRRERPSTRSRAATDSRRGEGSSDLRRAVQQSSQSSLPELFAKNLLERGEALGINKTVMNAVSEIRVNF